MSQKHLDKLHQSELVDLKKYIELGDQYSKVSAKGTFWHLDHSLKVIIAMCDNLMESDPKEFKNRSSFSKTVIFALRYIPRGAGRAPKAVIPPEEISIEALKSQLDAAISILKKYRNAGDDQFFAHPIFGHLKKRKTSRFLRIHTRHHLKIIRDIVKDKSH